MAPFAHFQAPFMQMAGKTANQGTKNPARVFHSTKISIVSMPRPNETNWNHALHNLENGHADLEALKLLLEYVLSFFNGFQDYAQIRRNATWLEFEAN